MSALVTALAEGESPETLAVMVIDLRRVLADVKVEIMAIKGEFGGPGNYGYETDMGKLLYRVYRMGLPIIDALDRVAP